jgi:putative transposase
MSLIKVSIHYVWSTKNRTPFLDSKSLRINVWRHIRRNAREKGIFVDMISGSADHCHCMVSMNPDLCIQDVARLLKGESSHWINENNLTKEKFKWQDEYFATSVSIDDLPRVREYIKQHNKK